MLPHLRWRPLSARLQEAAMLLIPAVIIIGAILALVYHLERTYPS